jgi:hypothetical protein
MIDLADIERSYLDNCLEKLEETTFDSFQFCQVLPGHGIQFMMYKISNMYSFHTAFHFTLERLLNLTTEVKESPIYNSLGREWVLPRQPLP